MNKIILSKKESDWIAQLPVCRGMSPEEINTFIGHLSGLAYESGELIFEQHQQANDHLFIILEGAVELTSQSKSTGSELHSVSQLKSGDVTGIFSFIDGMGHQFSAISKTAVRVAIISRQDYERLNDHYPGIAAMMMEYLKTSLKERFSLVSPIPAH